MSDNALTTRDTEHSIAVREALKTSLYPGASDDSVSMVLAYCQAASLDPMTKPVHIVPMWDKSIGGMRDVVMPGIGLYRTIAARTGCAGISEPEFGPDETRTIGGQDITFPSWCKITVRRQLQTGVIAEFTARELWIENYAVKGGKEKSIAPNAMWTKRPYGQIAKCAEAQALRKAFPEIGAQPTADEMEGREIDAPEIIQSTARVVEMPRAKQESTPAVEGAEHSPVSPAKPAPIRDVTPGIHGLTESQERILKARASSAGLTYPQLLDKYSRIDPANLNKVLNELRTIAEAQPETAA